jgi:hypothetical protein
MKKKLTTILLALSLLVPAFAAPARASSVCSHSSTSGIHVTSSTSKGQLGHKITGVIWTGGGHKTVYYVNYYRKNSSSSWSVTTYGWQGC